MTESDRAMDERPLAEGEQPRAPRLKDAVREARIDLAERTGVVVDLRNAEAARLQLLNDALDPIFADIPPDVELFDRGLVPGDPPRLWIDMIAHVAMGRDKRTYRFLQDTRYGQRVLMESGEVAEVAAAVTKYVARRLVERERALADDSELAMHEAHPAPAQQVRAAPARARSQRGRIFGAFVLGLIVGAAALLAIAWFVVRH
jgi:hypothetical protein